MSRASLPKITPRIALSKKIQLGGGDRELVIYLTVSALYLAMALSFAYGIWYGVPAFAILFFPGMKLLQKMGKYDAMMYPIWWRQQKYQSFYRARGRYKKPTLYPDWAK